MYSGLCWGVVYTGVHRVQSCAQGYTRTHAGFPGGSDGKESAGNAGDPGSIPGTGRAPGEEKEMATHFSILPWKIPWMEEPGGLQSMGSQRVGHD